MRDPNDSIKKYQSFIVEAHANGHATAAEIDRFVKSRMMSLPPDERMQIEEDVAAAARFGVNDPGKPYDAS